MSSVSSKKISRRRGLLTRDPTLLDSPTDQTHEHPSQNQHTNRFGKTVTLRSPSSPLNNVESTSEASLLKDSSTTIMSMSFGIADSGGLKNKHCSIVKCLLILCRNLLFFFFLSFYLYFSFHKLSV